MTPASLERAAPLASRRRRLFRRAADACLAAAVLVAAPLSPAKFVDVTAAVGIEDHEQINRHPSDFVVRGGSPIVMDFDGNGWLDLYIVRYNLPDILYLNQDGQFAQSLDPLGLDSKNGGNVAAWADIDNDGDKDMIVAVADENAHRLYLNQGSGSFVEAAAERGLDLPTTAKAHQGVAVTVGDVNRDGFLDVIYGDWGVDVDEDTRFEHYALLLNQGAANPGHFTNVTQSSGFEFFPPNINFFSPTITDLDQDGWPDLATVVDFGRSSLFWNNADGTFTNSSAASRIGIENHGMGTAIGDVDNDGDFDWWVTTIAMTRDLEGEINPLYVNQGGRLFQNVSASAGVAFGGWGWGTNLFDYDHDGDLDIVMVNQEDLTPEGPVDAGEMILWRNNGNLAFTDVSVAEDADHLARGAGLVTFDYDNDGDLDIFAIHQYSRPVLLRNDTANAKNWIQFTLEGTVSNRDGVGAVVTIQHAANGSTQIREFNPTNAYLAQLSPRLHFGLPLSNQTLSKVTIRWPSSIVQELENVSTRQILHIVEDESLLTANEPPVLAQQPQQQVATRGSTLSLSIATQGLGSSTVTWYRNGVLLAGVEGPELIIDDIQPRHAGTYHAVAANSAGSTESEPAIVAVRSDFSDRNVARQWNEAILDAARINFPDPPIVARTFFHASAALWDAYWTYQPDGWTRAQPLFHREDLAEAQWQGDRAAAQREAMSYAAYTVVVERYRKAFNHDAILLAFRDLMLDLGYDPDFADAQGDGPASVGIRIGQAILAAGLVDGSNEANGYADTTGYAPVNEPLVYGSSGVTLNDPNRWQPLNLTRSVTKNGIDLGPEVQQFLAPNWNWVEPFALEKPTESTILIDPGPQPLFGGDTEAQYIAEAVEVIRASSILDPTQEIYIDVSPGAPGQNNPFLTQDGQGHPLNPITGQPYPEYRVNQGDYFRVTAEFWSDGPGIEGPPGVWNMLHNQVSDDPRFSRRLAGSGPELSPLEWDVHAYLAINGAFHDAAIAAWTIKAKYDSIRPISMIRYLASLGQSSDPEQPNYHQSGLPLEPGLIEVVTEASAAPGQRHAHLNDHIGELAVLSWKGVPANPRSDIAGVDWILAADWAPYHLRTFPTPNFAGYVSGHSTFSRAGAEVMALLTGSPFFPGGLKEFRFDAGEVLQVEYGPREDLTIPVATYYDAADLTGVARIYCGVHIAADDFVGRKVGARVGTDAFLKVLSLRQGESASGALAAQEIVLPLHPDRPASLLRYQSDQPLPAHRLARAEAAPDGQPGLYALPVADHRLRLDANGSPLRRLTAKAHLDNASPMRIDFAVQGDEPLMLLASAAPTRTETQPLSQAELTLSLYRLSEDNEAERLDANQLWIEHPNASVASVLANRRDLAGDELPDNAAALPLALAAGTYRLQLDSDAPNGAAAELSLERVD